MTTPWFRFNIRFLLGAIGVLASVLAIIRFPTLFCVCLTVSVTIASLVTAALACAVCIGKRRAFCLGFALVGWSHLILALTTPSFAKGSSRLLLTRYCLDQLAQPLGYAFGANTYVEEESLANSLADYVPGSPPDRYYKYVVIGQSIFTMFLAQCGGLLGRYLYLARGSPND